MKNIEMKVINMDIDKELLINNLDLSERAKNALKRLNIKTFGELLEIDYEKLKNPRILGKNTLNDIVTFVRKKGYFLKNENVDCWLKTDKLIKMGVNLFYEEEITVNLYRFFSKNNIFRLEDLEVYGSNVFELEGIGRKRKTEIEDLLKRKKINLSENAAINTLEKIKKSGCYETSDLNIRIKDIGNFYCLSKDVLFYCYGDSLTLGELINIEYNELKEQIGEYIDYDNEILLEIVDFLHSYGLSIKGYDRTVFGFKLLSKEINSSLELSQDNIKISESENLISQNNLKKMRSLIERYNEIMTQRKILLEEEEKLDLEIKEFFSNMEQGVGYVREKK